MSAKWRLGVALMVPPPVRDEIDGIRRALGDGAMERVAPHVTIVPPVNVKGEQLDIALGLVRAAASSVVPFELEFGPVETFMPESPVIKLAVHGEGLLQLQRLRELAFVAPLLRETEWPYVPHVTLKDEGTPVQLAHVSEVATSYMTKVRFERVHVLHKVSGQSWQPIADAAFEPGSIVGRGGVELELRTTEMIDPVSARLLDGLVPASDLVIVARREGAPVGVVAGVSNGDDVHLLAFFVRPEVRGQGVGSHLMRHFLAESAGRGAELVVLAMEAGEEEVASFAGRFGFQGGVRSLT